MARPPSLPARAYEPAREHQLYADPGGPAAPAPPDLVGSMPGSHARAGRCDTRVRQAASTCIAGALFHPVSLGFGASHLFRCAIGGLARWWLDLQDFLEIGVPASPGHLMEAF